MNQNLYYGLNLKTWLLIGILVYSGAVLLVVLIRRCIKRKTCHFVFKNCNCIDWSYPNAENPFSKCKTISMAACCSGRPVQENRSCLAGVFPSVRCRRIPPDCSHLSCVCFELVCEPRNKIEPKCVSSESEV